MTRMSKLWLGMVAADDSSGQWSVASGGWAKRCAPAFHLIEIIDAHAMADDGDGSRGSQGAVFVITIVDAGFPDGADDEDSRARGIVFGFEGDDSVAEIIRNVRRAGTAEITEINCSAGLRMPVQPGTDFL